ncbi:MAG: DNA mismatch repair endonuclease MutL [Candidatus Marinimicrobia bacterium]|nr:DNA mismatch repair endonuclease MutL [Candidatus Neomarinimicrobiota bacterium]
MSKIRILSDQLTNKIAAGEVVERPASMVKELVENSIDAGATEIIIILRNGGKTLCEVVDNGEGMSKDDLLLAFERYATSKIHSAEDLSCIKSLGFRGEALASIASVARVSAISTLRGENVGYRLNIEGGNFRSIEPFAPKEGTTISVKNLFFNMPGRRKFLKSKEVEFRHIVTVIKKFSMIYPHIRFMLIHEDREVLSLRTENLKSRIGNLFSKEYIQNLVPFNYERGGISATGFIGNLNLVRATYGEQYFYVNNRFITDRLMNHAITAGFSSLISRGEYPFYCIHLSIPPERVDVNVHPRKMEVKFVDQDLVYRFLKESTADALKSIKNSIPDLPSFNPEHYYSPQPITFREKPQKPGPDFEQAPVNIENSTFPDANFQKTSAHRIVTPVVEQEGLNLHFSRKADQDLWKERADRFSSRNTLQREEDIKYFSPQVKVYQIHNKYLISQVKSGMVIIDQHVAHERILYEEALDSMQKNHWRAQQLLFPQVVELSLDDFSIILEILPYLEKLGFRLKEFGKNTVAVEAVPAGMKWGDEGKVIKNIIDYYREYGEKDTDIQHKVAASYACKAAIKAGDKLTEEEMQNLVDRLFATRDPYFCPHGRPIIVNMTLNEIDNRFERS